MNINGYTDSKVAEIRKGMDEKEMSMICLVETHNRGGKYEIKGWKNIEKKRTMEDKKGGGIAAIFDEAIFKVVEIETKSTEILPLKVICGGYKFLLMIIYWDVKDTNRNITIKKEMQRIMTNQEMEVIIIGDFNAHLQEFDGRTNQNTRIMRELIESEGLIILNGTAKAKGNFTWKRGDQETTIDFVLVSDSISNKIKKMEIDENKMWDFSDHNKISLVLQYESCENIRKKKWIKKQYWNVENEYKMKAFANECSRILKDRMEMDIDEIEGLMIKVAEKYLLTKINCKRDIRIEKFDKEISEAIKERRRVNRMRRRELNQEKKKDLEEEYREKKKQVHELVERKRNEEEEKEARWIMENKNENVWKIINKLTGKKERKMDRIVCIDGNPLEEKERNSEILEYWSLIYQGNHKKEERNYAIEVKKAEEATCLENERHLRDHNYCKRLTTWKETAEIRQKEVRKAIDELKYKKAAGLTGIKAEMWKELIKHGNSDVITKAFNTVMEGKIPKSWEESAVKLIPKTENVKVDVKDMRPVVITEISYKIMGGILKDKLYQFVIENKSLREEQAGFTRKKRMEENLLILQLEVERSLRRGSKMYIASLDIRKAFDKINRNELINTLEMLKVNEEIINVVSAIYEKDTAVLYWEEERLGEIKRNSGIKQGCKVSPLLFVLMMNRVIDRMNKMWTKRWNLLMYADDTIILAENESELTQKINVFKYEIKKLGLEINEEKSQVMVFGEKGKRMDPINNVKRVEEIKYLGIKLKNEKRMTKNHIKEKIKKGQKFDNWIKYMMRGKLMKAHIGKSIWKGAILPTLNYGMAAMSLKKKEIENLEKIQNKVYRGLLEMPKHTACEYLIGEIGSTTHRVRDMENKLGLLKHIMEDTIKLKKTIEEDRGKKVEWIETCERYMEEINLSWEEFEDMPKDELKKVLRRYKERDWRRNLEKKKSLKYYRGWKKQFGPVRIWKSTRRDRVIKRFQANVILTNSKVGKTEEDRNCVTCGVKEDLEHVIKSCRRFEQLREDFGITNHKKVEEILLEDEEFLFRLYKQWCR